MNSYEFPKDFVWGVATAAYQIEGASLEDGRKPSVWDVFCDKGGVRTGESGRIANDHYHRFEDDVRLMVELGYKHYRLSISWPRILPDGSGVVNEKGIDFYKRLLECLRRYGITPYVTLYHWDSPHALEERYGSWLSRRMADDFADYAYAVVRRLGDYVDHWFTLNEIPSFTNQSWTVDVPGMGMHAPGIRVQSLKQVHQTTFHALLAHGKAIPAIRSAATRPCRIALVDNTGITVPLTETPADIEAAQRAYQLAYCNGQIIFPLLQGKHSDLWQEYAESTGSMPDMQAGDLELIRQPLDLIGVNVYSGQYVRAADNRQGFEMVPMQGNYPVMDLDWFKFMPDAAYWAPRHLRDIFGFKGDIFITENGCPAPDVLERNNEIHDTTRILFLREYLRQFHRAIAEGMPVKGYFLWSLMDNFEWSYGYSKRCGIVWNTYETQQRIPKASARWYSACVRENRVV